MNKQTVLSKYFNPRPVTTALGSLAQKVGFKRPTPDPPSKEDVHNDGSPPKPVVKGDKDKKDAIATLMQKKPKVDKTVIIEPGILLLKKFLTLEEQQAISDLCFEKGEHKESGFYKPQVLVWNKLCQMKINQMCLGLHWNARTHKYEAVRSDHDTVHTLPELLKQHCDKIASETQKIDPTNIPLTNPNSCIVNFYEEGSTLGFHRDVSETKKSIDAGLPVISLSIGASADFQYYYGKDGRPNKKTILLESGDVLVFGGPARLIYHGVPKVYVEKFPKGLKMKTKGRLNITFREL